MTARISRTIEQYVWAKTNERAMAESLRRQAMLEQIVKQHNHLVPYFSTVLEQAVTQVRSEYLTKMRIGDTVELLVDAESSNDDNYIEPEAGEKGVVRKVLKNDVVLFFKDWYDDDEDTDEKDRGTCEVKIKDVKVVDSSFDPLAKYDLPEINGYSEYKLVSNIVRGMISGDSALQTKEGFQWAKRFSKIVSDLEKRYQLKEVVNASYLQLR